MLATLTPISTETDDWHANHAPEWVAKAFEDMTLAGEDYIAVCDAREAGLVSLDAMRDAWNTWKAAEERWNIAWAAWQEEKAQELAEPPADVVGLLAEMCPTAHAHAEPDIEYPEVELCPDCGAIL